MTAIPLFIHRFFISLLFVIVSFPLVIVRKSTNNIPKKRACPKVIASPSNCHAVKRLHASTSCLQILRCATNDETVGADLCVCPETSTSASGRTRRSAPTASSSNRFTPRVMGTQNDIAKGKQKDGFRAAWKSASALHLLTFMGSTHRCPVTSSLYLQCLGNSMTEQEASRKSEHIRRIFQIKTVILHEHVIIIPVVWT